MEMNMSKKEEKVWNYLLKNRQAENAEVANACDVDIHFVENLISRISSENWREEVSIEQTWDRAKILDTAKGYVTKDRAADHGDMEDNFQRIALYWNAHLVAAKLLVILRRKTMTDELKDMLLEYLRDMTRRGDYQAKLLLSLLEE